MISGGHRPDRPRLVGPRDLVLLAAHLASAVAARDERHWGRFASGFASLSSAASPGRERAAIERIRRFFPDGPPGGGTAEDLRRRLAERLALEVLIVERMRQRPDWRPSLAATGDDAVRADLALGGLSLWVAPQPNAMLFTSMHGHDAGWPMNRLSTERHGPSNTEFGRCFLNPRVRSVEDRFAHRIVIGPEGAEPALAALERAVRQSGVAQIHAVAAGRRPLVTPLLGGSIAFGVGAVKRVLATGRPVFAVTLRLERGEHVLDFARIAGAGEAVTLVELAERMAARIGESMMRDPANWRIYNRRSFLDGDALPRAGAAIHSQA